MFPYLAMLAVPGAFALTGTRRTGLLLAAVALLYWLMIAFRYQVGMDWFNYANIYQYEQRIPWDKIASRREPAFVLLNRVSGMLKGGPILVNVVSALVFTGGLYAFARRCQEPMLAIVVATPLLVVGLAMSGIRQAMGLGIVFYLFATWERRSTPSRFALVLLASLFHFSAIFVLAYVALASRSQLIVKAVALVIVAVVVLFAAQYKLEAVQAYSRLYVGSESKLSAPGAFIQIAPIAAAGLFYLFVRRHWIQANGDSPLDRAMAWSSVLIVPVVIVSSVGAYRFALYFWPFAMSVWSGVPGLIESGTGRLFYRLTVIAIAFGMLIGWLILANNSSAWMPYQSWLLQPPGAPMWHPKH